jgi:hypothetical protein
MSQQEVKKVMASITNLKHRAIIQTIYSPWAFACRNASI